MWNILGKFIKAIMGKRGLAERNPFGFKGENITITTWLYYNRLHERECCIISDFLIILY